MEVDNEEIDDQVYDEDFDANICPLCNSENVELIGSDEEDNELYSCDDCGCMYDSTGDIIEDDIDDIDDEDNEENLDLSDEEDEEDDMATDDVDDTE